MGRIVGEAFIGRGDPRRTMELLWRRDPPPSRGPRPALDVDQIVGAAIALADAEGLEGLTMRRLGAALGKGAMTVYTRVPGKGELLDLMVDAIHGELATAHDRGGGWRPAAEALAHDLAGMYARHPWALDVGGGRVPLGPHHLDAQEAGLAVFDGLGLAGVDMARALGLLQTFVRGAARELHDARRAQVVTGMSDDDWWNATAPLLDPAMDEGWRAAHPTIVRLSDGGAYDDPGADLPPEAAGEPYLVQVALDTFAFGLARVLDGLAQHIEG